MTLFIVNVLVILFIAYSAYRLGRATGWNQAADAFVEPVYDLYDRAYDQGYGKGFDDGATGLEDAVNAVTAWQAD